MFLLIVVLLVPLLVIVYKEIGCAKKRQMIRNIPGPPMLPFVGNAHQIGKKPHEVLNFVFNQWYKYGNCRIWIGYYLNVLVTDVKDIEFILSSTSLIAKSDVYDMLEPWLGDGLLTSKGYKWHSHRKMITPSFHFNILQDFYETMNVNSTKFIGKLKEVSKDGKIFDFQNMVHYLTMDVICDTAMGVHINAMDIPDSKFANAVKFLCCSIHMRVTHPLKRKNVTFQFFPEYKEFMNAVKVIQDFTYEVIEQRIQARKKEQANNVNAHADDNEFKRRKMAFLDTLLSSTVDGRPLTRQELYEEVSTFMFEGHDTTTSAITFTIFLLSRHLGIQQKVFEEQQMIMGDNMKRDATFQELSEMKYLDLVIKESLRLYPSVPIIGRLTEKQYNMNGQLLPADTSLLLFIMGMGYNEQVFPDPYRFNPERFEPSNRSGTQNPYEYVPFSAGPRNCVGQKFAMLEVKAVISKIVRNFHILPAVDELASKDGYISTYFGPYQEGRPKPHKFEPKLTAVLTLKSDNGVFLRLKERL